MWRGCGSLFVGPSTVPAVNAHLTSFEFLQFLAKLPLDDFMPPAVTDLAAAQNEAMLGEHLPLQSSARPHVHAQNKTM